ncbi:MAG: hypothetical protein CMH26_00110 [Micavibrio sp.]|nr:hypothetical protein [Micavibrio sp.]
MPQAQTDQLFSLSVQEEETLLKFSKKLHLRRLLDSFYDFYTVQSETAPFFADHSAADIEGLKDKQEEHWHKLLNKESRDTALKHAQEIGHIHALRGITPRLYLAGYSLVYQELMEQAYKSLNFVGSTKRKALIGAISKLLMSDITFSLTSYIEKNDETLTSHSKNDLAFHVVDDAIKASMTMNHLFVDNMKLSQLAIDVDQQVNSISAAIEEMSATVATINDNTEHALESAEQTQNSAQQGFQVSEKAMLTMNDIHDAVQDTTSKAHSLSESSKQIEGIITKIQDIAEQTNLLALNATIEAARAGEAGKGFAVVANEVKNLSNETSQATQEISTIIGGFVESIQNIVASMEHVSESVITGQQVSEDVKNRMEEIRNHANDVSQRMGSISVALDEQNQASREISGSSHHILNNSNKNKELSTVNAKLSRDSSETIANLITNIAHSVEQDSSMIIKLAKSDHLVWRRKISDAIMNQKTLDQALLNDHTKCRLGQWYYAIGQSDFGEHEAFRKLEEPHARIHALGKKAYELYQNKQYEQALATLDDVEAASHEVIELLNILDKDAQAQAHSQA